MRILFILFIIINAEVLNLVNIANERSSHNKPLEDSTVYLFSIFDDRKSSRRDAVMIRHQKLVDRLLRHKYFLLTFVILIKTLLDLPL